LLVEVDARTGFTDHLVHAGGQVTRSAGLKRHLLYVIIAEATNMGLVRWPPQPRSLMGPSRGPLSGTSGRDAGSSQRQEAAERPDQRDERVRHTARSTPPLRGINHCQVPQVSGSRLSSSSTISSASTAVRHVISAVVPTCGRGLSNNGTASGVSLDSRKVGWACTLRIADLDKRPDFNESAWMDASQDLEANPDNAGGAAIMTWGFLAVLLRFITLSRWDQSAACRDLPTLPRSHRPALSLRTPPQLDYRL
jgi:Tn3 transposase DDE domain